MTVLSLASSFMVSAEQGLSEAMIEHNTRKRYHGAYNAALYAAAALVSERMPPPLAGTAKRSGSVWDLLAHVVPEMAKWAAYFQQEASRVKASEAGVPYVVYARHANELMAEAAGFVDEAKQSMSAATP